MKVQPLIGQIDPVETTRYRVSAAIANFLAIDRGDIVYYVKELTRHMATPTTADWEKIVRLGRYCFSAASVPTPEDFDARVAFWHSLRNSTQRVSQRYTRCSLFLVVDLNNLVFYIPVFVFERKSCFGAYCEASSPGDPEHG